MWKEVEMRASIAEAPLRPDCKPRLRSAYRRLLTGRLLDRLQQASDDDEPLRVRDGEGAEFSFFHADGVVLFANRLGALDEVAALYDPNALPRPVERRLRRAVAPGADGQETAGVHWSTDGWAFLATGVLPPHAPHPAGVLGRRQRAVKHWTPSTAKALRAEPPLRVAKHRLQRLLRCVKALEWGVEDTGAGACLHVRFEADGVRWRGGVMEMRRP